jgi:AsmA protein
MKKVLKWLLGLFLILMLVLAGGFYYLTHYFDINQFKEQIAQTVFDKTGRKLTIAGNIRWTLFPSIAVEINQITLGNAPGFKEDFLNANKIALQVDTRALLSKQLKVRSVEIMEPTVHLQINAKGTNNWADMNQEHSTPNTSATESTTSPALAPLGLFEQFTLNKLQIKDANLSFSDDLAHKSYQAQHLHLQITDVELNQNFPIQFKADVIANNPDLSTAIDFNGQLHFDTANGTIRLSDAHLKNTLVMPDKPEMRSSIKLAIEYALATDNLKINLLQGTLLGLGEFDITGNVEHLSKNPVAVLKLVGKQILLPQGLKIDALKTSLQYRNQVADIPDLNLELYQGTYQGKIKVDHSKPALNINASGQLKEVGVANLLKDIAGDIPLAGTLSFEHQLNTIGVTSADLIANLYGPMSLNLDNGMISGLDISYIFALAKSKLENTETTRTDTGKTAIGYLTAKMMAENSMIKNTELKFQGDNYETTGKGTIRLRDFYVDYDLTAAMTKSQAQGNDWLNTPIPIKVTGVPPHLKSVPNFSVLFEQLLKQQMQNQSKKLLNRLTDKYGENLGEGVSDAIERGLGEEMKNLPFGDVFKKE